MEMDVGALRSKMNVSCPQARLRPVDQPADGLRREADSEDSEDPDDKGATPCGCPKNASPVLARESATACWTRNWSISKWPRTISSRLVETLILADLRLEDEIDEQATAFLLKNRPQLEEGSTAWDVEFERKKLGPVDGRGYVPF